MLSPLRAIIRELPPFLLELILGRCDFGRGSKKKELVKVNSHFFESVRAVLSHLSSKRGSIVDLRALATLACFVSKARILTARGIVRRLVGNLSKRGFSNKPERDYTSILV